MASACSRWPARWRWRWSPGSYSTGPCGQHGRAVAMLWALSLGLLSPVITRPLLWLAGSVAVALAPRAGHVAMITVRGPVPGPRP